MRKNISLLIACTVGGLIPSRCALLRSRQRLLNAVLSASELQEPAEPFASLPVEGEANGRFFSQPPGYRDLAGICRCKRGAVQSRRNNSPVPRLVDRPPRKLRIATKSKHEMRNDMNPRWINAAAVATALVVMPGFALAQSPNATTAAASADSMFMRDAIQGDLAEVQMGKLAQEKGTSEKVKQFGQKLVTDHSANLDKAKSVARSIGVTAPTEPSAEQKSMHDKLSKLSGPQFDAQFAQEMVQDHQKDVSKFQEASQKSGPAGDFAKQTIPTLREHLQMAQSLSGSTVGSGATSGSSQTKGPAH